MHIHNNSLAVPGISIRVTVRGDSNIPPDVRGACTHTVLIVVPSVPETAALVNETVGTVDRETQIS